MAIQPFKEPFTGKLDMNSPAVLLPIGAISDGKNVRKVGEEGGWKPRRGCTLHDVNTPVDSTNAVDSLHSYTNPRSSDQHFIAQCNSLLYKESAAGKLPPTTDPSFGTSLGIAVGTTPGFSTMVGETFLYADGSGAPVVWGGDTPYPFAVFWYDAGLAEYIDITRKVTDSRSDTDGFYNGTESSTDYMVIVTTEIASAFTFTFGTNTNNTASVITLSAWRSGAWAGVTGTSDGTITDGKSMYDDGTISWTAGADEQLMVNNVLGYAYKLIWSVNFDKDIDITDITTVMAATNLTNKWDGSFEWVSGCRHWDASAGEYIEVLGKVTNESTAQYLDLSSAPGSGGTQDYLWIKCPEPATAFAFGIPAGYANTTAADAKIDEIMHWDGDALVAVSDMIDYTLEDTAVSSFCHTGVVHWDGSANTSVPRTLKGDRIPGYWYRVRWDGAALAADTRIYMILYTPFPESLPAYDGVVEFKGRAAVWGDPEFPNRLRISARDRYDCFSGTDSTYTDQFGGMSKVNCAINFYNELIVFKEDSVWMLEGYDPPTFGVARIVDTVGLASPKTAHVIEVGFPGMSEEEPLSIAIWQDVDGVYVLDGRKPRKVSDPIDNYFNPEHADCIPAANIKTLQAFVDRINNEYHLQLPTEELVYNYVTDEWYPPWARALPLKTAVNLKGSDDRYYTYGGTSAGWIMKLETDTTDKNVSNADVAIDHSVTTRAISGVQKTSTSNEFTLRKLWAELLAQSAGTLTTTLYKDQASSGTALATPSALSMVSAASAGVVSPKLDVSTEACINFSIQFRLNVVDQEMEIYSMIYGIEVRRLPKA